MILLQHVREIYFLEKFVLFHQGDISEESCVGPHKLHLYSSVQLNTLRNVDVAV